MNSRLERDQKQFEQGNNTSAKPKEQPFLYVQLSHEHGQVVNIVCIITFHYGIFETGEVSVSENYLPSFLTPFLPCLFLLWIVPGNKYNKTMSIVVQ